jgi:hypothetical protein
MEPSSLSGIKQLIESISNYAELVGCAYGVCFAVGSALVFSLGKARCAALYFGFAIVIALCGLLAPGLINFIQASLMDAKREDSLICLAIVSAAVTGLIQLGLVSLPIIIARRKSIPLKLVITLSLCGAASLLLFRQFFADSIEVQLALPLLWSFSLYFAHEEKKEKNSANESPLSD